MLKKSLYFSIIALSLTSCGEDLMDRINEDHSNPAAEVVSAKFQVTDATMCTAFSTWCGDYAFYVSSYTEQTFGTGNNQLMKAELRDRVETANSTTFNNVWNATYGNLLNIKQMIAKCGEGGINAGQKDIEGIGQLLWVLSYEALTDMHGDIPYSEALASKQPKLDSQESIYQDLLKRTEIAEKLLSEASEEGLNNCGSQDILYSGDPQKWLGLAHAVKARLLMNTSFRDSSVWPKVVEAAEAALQAGFNGAELSVFNGVDCDNSWAAYFWSRYYTGANGTTVALMTERNDPRLNVYAVDMFGSGISYAEAGDAQMAMLSEAVGCPLWLDNGAAGLHIFSLSEIHFILAEAKVRLGQDASADLAKGVEASFADMSATTGENLDPSQYIAALPVTFEEVMVQKYIAQCRDEQLQTYNDIRRLKAEGKSVITLKNPNNDKSGVNQWPLRMPYGNSDVISNPNVTKAFGSGNEAGNYIFTENVWLFGGTR